MSTATLGSLLYGQSLAAPLSCRLAFRSAASCSCSSTCAFRLCTTPSSRRNLSMSSPSGGFLLFRGARPGPGNTHSILARAQFEHGCFLSHLTFLRRHVTQERGFGVGAPEAPLMLPFGFWTRSLAAAVCRISSDMATWELRHWGREGVSGREGRADLGLSLRRWWARGWRMRLIPVEIGRRRCLHKE